MKSVNLQNLAVEHAEKAVLAVVGLVFVFALFSAFTRETTDVTPEELSRLAAQAEARLETGYDDAGARGRDQVLYLAQVARGLQNADFESVRVEVPASTGADIEQLRARLAGGDLGDVPVVVNEEITEPRVAVDDWIEEPIAMLTERITGDYRFEGPLYVTPMAGRERNDAVQLAAVQDPRVLYERVPVYVHPPQEPEEEDEREGRRQNRDVAGVPGAQPQIVNPAEIFEQMQQAARGDEDEEEDEPARVVGSVDGFRWVAVRAVVPVAQHRQEIARALRLPRASDAGPYLAYVDFEVQRQRAVPGPDPWPDDEDSWETVPFDRIVEHYARMEGEDAEVVDLAYINSTLAAPLPPRAIGVWDVAGTHPALRILSEVEREEQQQAVQEQFQELEEDALLPGLRGADLFRERIRASGGSAGTFGSTPMLGESSTQDAPSGPGGGMASSAAMAQEMIERMRAMQPGQAAPTTSRDMMPPMGVGGFMATNSMDLVRSGVLGARGQAVDANELLFRFFDFTVAPGQAYRYRVRIVLANPNYGLDPSQLTEDALAQADQPIVRTPWSEPTSPVQIPPDTSYYVAGVQPERNQVLLRSVAWDRDLGTLAEAVLWAGLGDEIAGLRPTTRANPETQTVDDGTRVEFDSNDILLDFVEGRAVEVSLDALADDEAGSAGGPPRARLEAPTDVLILNQWGGLVLRNDAADAPRYAAAAESVEQEQLLYEEVEDEDEDDDDTFESYGSRYYEQFLQGSSPAGTRNRRR